MEEKLRTCFIIYGMTTSFRIHHYCKLTDRVQHDAIVGLMRDQRIYFESLEMCKGSNISTHIFTLLKYFNISKYNCIANFQSIKNSLPILDWYPKKNLQMHKNSFIAQLTITFMIKKKKNQQPRIAKFRGDNAEILCGCSTMFLTMQKTFFQIGRAHV